MPGPLLLIASSAASFALGFLARSVTNKSQPASKGSKASGKGKTAKPAGVTKPAPSRPREEMKMVLCVNESLKMGKGKVAAQCAHAALGVTQQYRSRYETIFRHWEYGGQAKIALKIDSSEDMETLSAKAASLDIPTYIVHDAGRTQIPAGSQTVLAIGPGPKSVVDQVTGHLKLL